MVAHDENEPAVGVARNEAINPILDARQRFAQVGIYRPLEVEDIAVEDENVGPGNFLADVLEQRLGLRSMGKQVEVGYDRITSYNVCYTKLLRCGWRGRWTEARRGLRGRE